MKIKLGDDSIITSRARRNINLIVEIHDLVELSRKQNFCQNDVNFGVCSIHNESPVSILFFSFT